MLSTQNNPVKQNETDFFYITKNNWKYSIDLNISNHLQIDILNLFLIFKSYLTLEDVLLKEIFLISKNAINEETVPIFYKINIKKLKKMNFREFENWFEETYENDFEYLKSYKFWGFRFLFFEESQYWKNEEIFPIYPWKKEFIKEQLGDVEPFEEIEKLRRQIEFLKKQLESLKKDKK